MAEMSLLLKRFYNRTVVMIFLNRLIQEEKQSTEQRAEELESRVGSIEHMNLLLQSQAGPQSGYAGPNSHPVQRLTVPPQPPPR
jgi:hypothetical protein